MVDFYVQISRHAHVRRGPRSLLIPGSEVTSDDRCRLFFTWEDPMRTEPPDSGHLDLRPFAERRKET